MELRHWGGGQRFTGVPHHVTIGAVPKIGVSPSNMNDRKTIRILGVLLTLVGVIVFTTVVVSHWHNEASSDDARCPYCYQGHQTAVQPEIGQNIAVLLLVASLPLLEDVISSAGPPLSQSAPRAPPSA